MKKYCFTATQIVLILGILLTIFSLFIINVISKYQEKSFGTAYNNEVQKISNMVDNILLAENEDSFFSTTMYSDTKPSDYSKTSGYFLKTYIGINKDCGNSNSACFASNYKNEDKTDYSANFEGACAILRNGASICLRPQIDETPAGGIIDINGKKGPNVFGKDLRTFDIDKREKPVWMNVEQAEVITVE